MEEVNCYNCRSSARRFYASENGFNLAKCLHCGLLYVTPLPSLEEIEKAHRAGIHPGDIPLEVTGQFKERKVKWYQKVLKDIYSNHQSLGGKTWLDIGCGHGEFIQALNDFTNGGIKVKGLEPNIHKQNAAQRRGLDVAYFDVETHANQYDIISALNVFAHLPHPIKSINNWKNLIKPNGEILLETGDSAGLDSKDHPRPFLLPDHLSFASEEIVITILESIGFEIIKVQKYPFIKLHNINLLIELAKLFHPRKQSEIRYLSKKYHIDMYVRAQRVS